MSSDPLAELAGYLTAHEAEVIAARVGNGGGLNAALHAVTAPRREHVRLLIREAGLGSDDPARLAEILRAIAGAKSAAPEISPVWTMPGHEVTVGHLTSQFHKSVEAATQSVTCATYNFQESSQMWPVLRQASERNGLGVVIYVDRGVADAVAVKKQVPSALVYQSGTLPGGKPITSHAKFVIIDHETILLTSANFSKSAEQKNIEFGLRIYDRNLATSIESTMSKKRGILYEEVQY